MEPLQRSGLFPDALSGIMDPLKAQDLCIVAQLAKGGHARVALETQRPECLLESQSVGYSLFAYLQCIWVRPEMPDLLRREFLLRAHTAPPSDYFILSQMRFL